MNKFRHLGGLLLGLACVVNLQAQNVIRINRPYILIDLSANSGVRVGDDLNVYYLNSSGQPAIAGKVEVVVFRGNNCGAKILEENRRRPIEVGDFATLPGPDEQSIFSPQAKPAKPQRPSQTKQTLRQAEKTLWPAYLSAGAGLVSCGLGVYFNFQGNNAHDELQNIPAGSADFATYTSRVQRYDRQRDFSYGLGGGLIVFGIINYFVYRNTPPAQDPLFSLYSVNQSGLQGVGVKFSLD